MADSNKQRDRYDYLRRLNVDQLAKLLQLAVDPQSDGEDSAYVDAILEVMVEKEKEADLTGYLSDVDRKWDEFQQHYNTPEGKGQFLYYSEADQQATPKNQAQTDQPSKRKRFNKLKRTLLAAALIVLVLSITAVPVLGYKNVIQLVSQWTGQQFTFDNKDDESAWGMIDDIPEEYQDLVIALEKRGVENVPIPRFIPEGFLFDDSVLYIAPKTGNIRFSVTYVKEQHYILFDAIQNVEEAQTIYEKSREKPERYVINGIEYIIFQNRESCLAAWSLEGVEYSIDTTLSVADLKELIDSIWIWRDSYEK